MKRFSVTVTIDRPKGYVDKFNNVYPLNYGYVEGILAGDKDWQDAYIFDELAQGVTHFKGEVIAVIIRDDDVEDKWVVAKEGVTLSTEEIYLKVQFIEQYFNSTIILLD
ncbi:inorganic pyrophosphatase [Vagococcus hydrophili]|uniref:Inorganic pyrophosphatase n=1 Tax=Vagococcus hydrophili TaxID=2714947 RepID=A0A6G8AW43_9ENTE|nr:inorganic pyrophosphatase [Vagococcus hydrophili]QIL49217.1 inorganic pyrophosphatase [Vagococcus hydrophili]